MFPEMEIFLGLDLPPRAAAALMRNQITSTEALVRLNARELRALPGVGPGTMQMILDALAGADLVLADDPWAPYACVRHGMRGGDVSLATFFLCAPCRDLFVMGAFSGEEPAWIGTQLVEGYCGHCNRPRLDIRATQWLLCGICERVVRSIGRGLAAAKYVMQVWEQNIAGTVPQTILVETDPPELRSQGRRSEAIRDSMPDFTGFNSDEPDTPLFGFELKSGKSAASTSGGVGSPMTRFQLDTTDCDDILSIADREVIPIYLVHVQVIGRAHPPTERFHGVGFWWTDLWTMQSSFENVQIRPRETRNAAYYATRIFKSVSSLADHLSTDGYVQDRERLIEQGSPWIYRLDGRS
jgi:hypothetical protein